MIIDNIGLERYLLRTNPWWATGIVDKARSKISRENLPRIMKELSLERTVQLLGPRRAGKTTTIHMIIDKLIGSGVGPERLLYVSLDDPMLRNFCSEPLSDTLEFFLGNAPKGRNYAFLDEVQKVKGWYEWIKGYHDREQNLKMVISGSSSLALQKEANTYLRGRVISFVQHPFNLREFLGMDGFKIETPHFLDDSLEMSKKYGSIRDHLMEYLRVGGYPEWFQLRTVPDSSVWFDRLYEDVPKKAFYEDIVELFNIRSPRALELLFVFIAQNQSRILSYEAMNRIVGLDRSTILDYLAYLKASYLVIEVPVFSEKISTQEKSMKKYLISDQGIRNGILKEYSIKEENLGFIVETVVGIYLHRFCEENGLSLNYVKSNGEIDFILTGKDRTVPVEVKTSDRFKISTTMKNFIKEKGSPFGVVITDRSAGQFEVEEIMIREVPLWVLLTGNIEKEVWS